MKIAYIGGAYVPSRGADSMHHMGMCEAMADLGHDVTLHVRPGPEPCSNDYDFYGVRPNFRLVKHPRPAVRGVGALVNGWHVARDIKTSPAPDLLYAREHYGLVFTAQRGIPIVFESHWKPRYALQRELEAWLFRRPSFRRLVVISAALRRIYQELFPWLPEARIVVAHDAANPPRVQPLEEGVKRSSRLQVGYVGGLLHGYGIEIIVGLASAHPEADFHVVGGLEAALAEWREKTKHASNLTFHGFAEPRTLAMKYAGFDVVLAPFQRATRSIDWASPMKLFEYMAHAKAIICSDFPIMREILTHDVDGLLVTSDDVTSWSSALQRLKDSALRERLGSAALQRLDAEFTWRRRAERVLAGL